MWTYAYDVSGLQSVTLKYRVDGDGHNPLDSTQNETYAGGAEVGDWVSIDMTSSDVIPPSGIESPTARALRFSGMIEGLEDVLVDYYVEAVDSFGNLQQTDIQHVYVGDSTAVGGADRVVLTPDPIVAGQDATITFDPAGGPLSGASQVYAHVGFNSWSDVLPTDPAMLWDSSEELWSLTVPIPLDAQELDLAFNDGGGVWDNNGGADWRLTVSGGTDPVEFVMDGQLDEGAQIAMSANGITLYWKLDGDKLYLATEDAGEGADVFIYLADTPGAAVAANWAKAGQIAEWDAFLADENDNDYESWFDAEGSTEASTGANGGVLEGVIDLGDEFGEIPEELRVAVAHFGTADGGALLQLLGAATPGSGIEAGEYLSLQLVVGLTGDYNGDGLVDAADYTLWRDTLGSTTDLAADGDGNGVVDLADFQLWRDNFGAVAASSSSAAVPEPAAFGLALLAALAGCRRRG